MQKYNPNQNLRFWSAVPVYVMLTFVFADIFSRFLFRAPLFYFDTWFIYFLFAAGIGFCLYTWWSFPVYYANRQYQVFYCRILRKISIPPGDVVVIAPVTGRVNLFFRPQGWQIVVSSDDETYKRLYVLRGERDFEKLLQAAFPGKMKPDYPQNAPGTEDVDDSTEDIQ